jgi:hypothetical protein
MTFDLQMEIQSSTKKAPWSLGSFSKQIRFILSKPHLNFIYKFIYDIYRRSLLQISNGQGETTPFYFQKCWPMHRITWFSYTIRAQPLNIKGYFGIIYPTTIKKHNIHQWLRHNHNFENLLATVSLKVISRKCRPKCTLRVTTISLIGRIYDFW